MIFFSTQNFMMAEANFVSQFLNLMMAEADFVSQFLLRENGYFTGHNMSESP